MMVSGKSDIRTGGDADLAFAVVVLASYFATFSGLKDPSPVEIILMMGLGISYLAIGIYGYSIAVRSSSIVLKMLYFAIQIPLGAAIVFLGKGAGYNALVLMPLAAHAVILLPNRNSYIALLVIVAVYIATVYLYGGSVQVVWNGFPTFIAGLIFIVVFTQMTLNEEASRREVERLLGELTVANQQLRDYALQVEDLATMKERNRLAREIHDGLGHYLTTINMQIQAAKAVSYKNPEKSDEMLAKAQLLTQEALADVRKSVAALRSSTERSENLSEQIGTLFGNLTSFEIEGKLIVEGNERSLDLPSYWALFRAAQEGISNTCKHAKAKHIWINLDYHDPESVRLVVRDDGLGADTIQGGYGLTGLKERVNHLGGTVEINPQKGEGFSFEVKIPG
jgi:signal transduction histidine kinase